MIGEVEGNRKITRFATFPFRRITAGTLPSP